MGLHLAAQHGVGLMHLGTNAVQGNRYNAAYVPWEGKVFVGLPALSGMSFGYNNRVAYQDMFRKDPESDSVLLDWSMMASSMKPNNFFWFQGDVNSFFLGFRPTKYSPTTYFFGNEILDVYWTFSNEEFDLLLTGNESGQKLDFSKLAVFARYYREIGVGFTMPIPDYGMTFGFRGKRLIGMFDASLDPKFSASMETRSNNSIFFDFQNAVFHTSGFDDATTSNIGSHLINNKNGGWGVDLGFDWRLNDFYSFSAALNDVGFITWQDGIVNYTAQDDQINYTGFDLDNDSLDIDQFIRDSLVDRFQTAELKNKYTTWLNPNLNLVWTVHFDKHSEIKASLMSHYIYGKLRNVYGVGYMRKVGRWLRVSANAIKAPQNFFEVGGAISLTGSVVQLHLAADRTLGYRDMTTFKQGDISLGINFIFGRPKAPKKDKQAEYDNPYAPPVNLDHPHRPEKPTIVTAKDGRIYTLIKKLVPPEKWEKWVAGKNKQETHKASGKTAKDYKKKRYKYKPLNQK